MDFINIVVGMIIVFFGYNIYNQRRIEKDEQKSAEKIKKISEKYDKQKMSDTYNSINNRFS